MRIFQEVDPPRRQAQLKINKLAHWYTWSDEFLNFFYALSGKIDAIDAPLHIRVLGGKEYDDTYTVDLTSIQKDKSLAGQLTLYARDLFELEVSNQLMLLTDLLGHPSRGLSLHLLFACLRAAIISITGDPLSALSQPLGRGQRTGTEFPLHADLYVPQILFNVFEDVPDDRSGASIFLPVSLLKDLLLRIKSIPQKDRAKIIHYVTEIHDEDFYEETYDLLHGDHEWSEELARLMQAQRSRIKLYSGQGYVVNDRRWLHGREAPSGRITKRRFHRLVFNNREAQRVRNGMRHSAPPSQS